MADYESNAHNVYFTASFLPDPKVHLVGTIGYNKSTAELKTVTMPDISDRISADPVFPGEIETDPEKFEFTDLPDYSDLDYELIQFSFGIAYEVSPGVRLTADADYADLTDNQGYVYGIESGSLFIIRTGIQFDF